MTNPAPGGGTSNTQTFTLIDPALLYRITVSPSSPSVAVNGSQTFTAQGYDQYNNAVSIIPTWSIASGQSDAGSIDSSTGIFTAGTTVNTYSNAIVATSGSISGYASVTVTAGSLYVITVSPSNPPVAVNGGQTFTAQGYDQYNNAVNITPTWSIASGQSAAGSINSSTGVFTAGTAANTFSNAIVAASGGKTGTASVTVTGGSLNSITVSPSNPPVAVNGSQTFTAQGYDQYNNPVSATYTWSIASGQYRRQHQFQHGYLHRRNHSRYL